MPWEVEDIVRHCLEKNPDDRFRSARDLIFALRIAERAISRAPASDSGAPAAAATPQPRSLEPSIAVLPFRNVMAGTEGEYFSDGMTEEIIAALSRVPGLRVAARTSSFAFRGRNDDVRRIGAELAVATVLEGSVRLMESRLRVSAQLIDVTTGYNLWSERWDRELADVFAVQDEIARAIAETLQPRLLGGIAQTGLVAPPTRDVHAYDRLLKGRYLWKERRLREAIAEFEAAAERDPAFTEAHTGIAETWAAWGFYGGVPTWEAWARARSAADRAAELAPESSDVPRCFGVLEHYYGWNTAREERFCRLALERSPRLAEGYFWLALCLGAMGRLEEAVEFGRRGTELEPHSANMRAALAWPYLFAHRGREAEAELARAVTLEDRAPFALWSHGCALQALDRHEEAMGAYRKAAEVTGPGYSFYAALLAGALAAAGRHSEAESALASLDARAAQEYVPPFDRAVVLVQLGRLTEAVDALERAYEERNALLWARIYLPQFHRLADDQRFRQLAAKLARSAPTRLTASGIV